MEKQTDTAHIDLALSYAEAGIPVFPCRDEDEYDDATKEVMPEKSPLISNGFRGATLNERIIRAMWGRHPNAVVGIPTGERSGVWVLDLDIKPNANGHEWLARMEDEHGPLPYSARVRTANGGTHILFRHVAGVRNRGKLGGGVDVRGDGGYVISAGSVLAGGREYQWIDETSFDTVVEAPQWLLDLVLPPKYEHEPGLSSYVPGTNDSYIRRAMESELDVLAGTYPGRRGEQLNMSAYSLGQLVGAGALDRSEAEHGLYSAAVTCGIVKKDGDRTVQKAIRRGLDAGQANPRNIPVLKEDDTDLSGFVERFFAKKAEKEENKPNIAPTELSEEAVSAHAASEDDDDSDVSVFSKPIDLSNVPGLVGDIANWLTDSARNPAPILNLGAALTYVGALAGRRYEGPTGLRTNIYIVGLAPSGFGKEHPRAGVKSLATASNTLAKFFGGNKIASSSGLRNRVKKNPTLVYMIDEFGGFMRKVTSPKSGNHEKEIAEDLLEMTGTAGSVFMGADYAQNLAEPIHNPNVCIFGTSTPEAFWKALGSGSIMDGFLPRFVVLDAGTERPKPRDPKKKVSSPPTDLIDKVQSLVLHTNGGKMNAMQADGGAPVKPFPVMWGKGAKKVFDAFAAEMFETMDRSDPEHDPVYARVAENAIKIATIVAVGVDSERPEISADIMRWSTDVARRSCRMLLEQAERYVADNDRQAEYKLVRAIVGEGKRHGMKRSYLLKRLNGRLDRRRGEDIVNLLIDAEEIVDVIVTPPSGGKRSSVLYLAKYAPPPEPQQEAKEAA